MNSVRIEAEDYNQGGQGVAYYDLDPGNNGGEYRFEDVDISYSGDVDGTPLVGWIESGEWLTYEVTIPSSGTYQLEARVASALNGNHSFQVSLDGEQANVNLGNTGGWRTWQTIESSEVLSLSAGTYQLRLDVLSGGFNINYIDLIPVSPSVTPTPEVGNGNNGGTDNNTSNQGNGDTITDVQTNGSTVRIEAEDYNQGGQGVAYYDRDPGNNGGEYRFEDVDISYSGDVDGTPLVGWIESGEWLTYEVTIPSSGTYQLEARVASALNGNHSFQVSLDGEQANVNLGNTGGWRTWQTIESSEVLSLSAGTYQLRLDVLSGGFNINYIDLIPVSPSVTPTPEVGNGNNGGTDNNTSNQGNGDTITDVQTNGSTVRIEAEDYNQGGQGVAYYDRDPGNNGGEYRFEDVDISYSGDVDGTPLVGWIESGEWLTYEVTIPSSGTYQLEARVASALNGNHSFQVSLDGEQANVNLGNTGGWRTWQTIESSEVLSLSAGTYQLRLDVLSGGFNINYIDLIPVSPSVTPTPEAEPELDPPTVNFGNVINGGTGDNTFNGGNGIDTITYVQANGSIIANLETDIVTHKFATSPDTPFKIMPLGDSNTFGLPGRDWGDTAAYRDDLWNLLVDDSFNIDFVGPRSTGPDGFDKDNAGFGGWRIRDIANNVNGWLNTYQPDMVLLMIGTNDILKGDDISNAPLRLSNLIDQITNQLPNTELLVSSIPPLGTNPEQPDSDFIPTPAQQQQGIDFNLSIPDIVSDKVEEDKNVTFVDVYSALVPSDLPDGVHPNVEGYGKVADVWYNSILNTNSGEDTLNDIENMIGSPYDDILIGDGDVNIINGGGGNDLLTGGASDDIFVLAPGEGTKTITDFVVGEDWLALSGGLRWEQLTITQGTGSNTNDTWIINGGEQLALLNRVQATTITSDSFTLV
ncbi:MAG: carbohydrate-binding protein [Moorea sp. SIOASIH]|uniref:carbohydrate-binding protein n=1 Tax=Moorena sp. SIOASIH TaxID=2607817 RepID=UPI0013B6BDE6|nr:carbohydrate-binding protein [Moorena sp. SIOASIH]NEO35074.1 carbohydrate-binding protein [Moorena sp. SIOASIH]